MPKDEKPTIFDEIWLDLRLIFRQMGLAAMKVPKNVWYVWNSAYIVFILLMQWHLFGFLAAFLTLWVFFTCFAWFCTFMRDK